MPVSYPFDFTGNAPSNRITGELHAVSESTYGTYSFIVPNFAPFYVDNFSATITQNNVTRPLVEDVDFSFALEYVTGTRTVGKVLYGAITLHNLTLNDGIITLNYQTLGGNIADRLQILTKLAELAYNPRTTIFDNLIDTPAALPPVPHYNDYDQFYGQEELVTTLGQIRDAIIQNSSLTQAEINNFLNIINSQININNFVRKTGDEMMGYLKLNGNPVEPLHAATKQYVDSNTVNVSNLYSMLSSYATISYTDTQDATKVSKSGDTMTGPLTLSGNPTQPLEAATKQYVDANYTTLRNQLTSTQNNLQSQINSLQAQINNLTVNSTLKDYIDARINEIIALINSNN